MSTEAANEYGNATPRANAACEIPHRGSQTAQGGRSNPVLTFMPLQDGIGFALPPFIRPSSTRAGLRRAASILAAGITVAVLATAQTQVDLRTQTKNVDFSQAAATKPVKVGTSLPSTCNQGELFLNIGISAGGNLFACTSSNTWTVQGSPGSLSIASDGATAGSRNLLNFQTGSGMLSVITDTGAQINIQSSLDTAVVQTQFGEQTGVALLCASASNSSSSYTCAMSPTMTAYNTGMVLHWKPDVSSPGGPTTLNIDTLGAVSVKESDGSTDLSSTDLAAGRLYNIWYDGSVFRLLAAAAASSGGSSGSGSTSFGIIDLPAGGSQSGNISPGFWVLAGGGGNGGSAGQGIPFVNTGAPFSAAVIRLPLDVDTTQPVSFIVAATNLNGSGGSLQFNLKIGCFAAGTPTYIDVTYGAAQSSGAFTQGGNTLAQSGWVAGVDLSGGSCSPGSLAKIVLTRDNTVSGNMGDTSVVVDVAVKYTRN